MKFSTVTPLYNGRSWIAQLLDSLRAQTLPPAEIIVVDDGSTDGSAEIVRNYPDVRFLTNPAKGANAARRYGIAQARHPLLAVVDQDDVLHPQHFARLAPVLHASPEVPGAVAGAVPLRNEEIPAFTLESGENQPLDPWALFPVNPVATSGQVLFRRQLLQELGGWETRFPGVGEFHAWLTLSARRPFVRVPGHTVGQRLHATSHGHAPRRRNRWVYCDRFLSAAQDRVGLRLRYHPSDGARVKARLRLARHLFAWRFADALLSPEQTAPMAAQVDQLLADEPPEWQQTLLDQVFALFPIDERPTTLRKAVGWLRLYQRCPRDGGNLRAALRQHLQRSFHGPLPALDAT